MNSALKPVISGTAVTAGGQASPAKGNVATANHAPVGLPQGANSLHNSLVGQNLSQPSGQTPPLHAVPSMAPVSANMAQMAQNMSHHGNLSHLNQNSAPPPVAASPAKTSSPLSLVQDKVNASQPLALTRTPEKKEPDSSNSAGHSNGSIDSPKSGASAPASLKPQNPEPNKDKQDIAKTSPSTPKPPEKPAVPNVPTTPQKPEGASGANKVEGAAQPKVATGNDSPEKSPSKPAEPTPAPTADVAPSQSDNKPVPESANNQSSSQLSNQSSSQAEKAPTPVKQEPPPESAKTEPVAEKKEPEKPKEEEKKEESKEKEKVEPKKEAQPTPTPEKPQEKEAKKVETRPKSTLKLATVTPPIRKRRQTSPAKDGPSPPKKLAEGDATPESRTKRNRTKVQLYQSPTPELTMATKLSASAGRATPTKPNDDKLIVFYKNEYLAVRNAEGGFYVCQAMQNVYRSTRKIKIRWLSQDKTADPSGETYKPDFYDVTDMECVLTTLSLSRAGGGGQVLRAAERARASSILQRALRAEPVCLTAEHPDGLDLSLYTDESQLDKKTKRNASKSSPRNKNDSSTDVEKEPSPKKARTPKRSPKKAKTKSKPLKTNNKKPTPGSVAPSSKTATAVSEKSTPARGKRTPAKKETPAPTPTRGRRAAKESKPSPIVATPSTSTGKTTRTPRKPPARK